MQFKTSFFSYFSIYCQNDLLIFYYCYRIAESSLKLAEDITEQLVILLTSPADLPFRDQKRNIPTLFLRDCIALSYSTTTSDQQLFVQHAHLKQITDLANRMIQNTLEKLIEHIVDSSEQPNTKIEQQKEGESNKAAPNIPLECKEEDAPVLHLLDDLMRVKINKIDK